MNTDMGVIRELYDLGVEAGIDFGDIEPRNAHFVTIHPHFDVDCGWIPNEFDDDHATAIVRDKTRERLMEKHETYIKKLCGLWLIDWGDPDVVTILSYLTYDLAMVAAMKHTKGVK